MSQIATISRNTAVGVKSDPAGAMKVLLFVLIGIILVVALFKFLRGFGKATELLSDFGPSTETEKREVISKASYQDNLKWLGGLIGAQEIGKTKKFKNTDAYLSYYKTTWDNVNKAADAIWKAKFPGYISETEVYNAVASMPTKAAVSLLAASFNAKYGKLWNGGELQIWLPKYLKLSEMETLTELISKKPTV